MHASLKHYIAQLLAQPSISCTLASIDQSNLGVIELLNTWFSEEGLHCQVIPVYQTEQGKTKANLIASLQPAHPYTKPGLTLSGHTDTVPTDFSLWHSDPFTLAERENRWYGLGSADMKSFFAIILVALQELKAEGALQPHCIVGPLTLVATCDEETSMAGARALQTSQLAGRFALIGEPTSLKPIRAHKGVMLERIIAEGQAGHSSDPNLGNNAIDAMHRVISELTHLRETFTLTQNRLFHVPYTTLNFGCIHGGDNPNRICGLCELQFDIRPLPEVDTHALRQHIQHIVQHVAQEHRIQLRYEPITEGVPAVETPATSAFVQYLEQLTGQPAGVVGFGTEAPFFNAHGLETVIMGAGSIDQAHQPNEYIDIEQAIQMVHRVKQLIRHYCLA